MGDFPVIELASGGYNARLQPAAGGRLLSLSKDGRALLRAQTHALTADGAAADPREAACFPCAPYFGRLAGGLLFGRRRWPLKPTLPACDADHALHGEAWVRRWALRDQSMDRADMRYRHRGDEPGAYPFAYEAAQIVRVAEEGLRIDLTLTNLGDGPMPAGLGLHPYLHRTPDTRVSFSASGMWTPPTGGSDGALGPLAGALGSGALGSGAAARLPAETLDHSFAGFSGEALIETGDLQIALRSDAPILHVYAPTGADFFCLEPVTHLPGDFGRDVIEAGQRLTLAMTIALN